MRSALDSTLYATDLADYLVGKSVPFREAHALAGKAVRAAGQGRISMEQMPLEAYQSLSPAFEADVFDVFNPRTSIDKRNSIGGTGLQSVKNQIQLAKSIHSPTRGMEKTKGE